jgi:acetate kinase
MDVLVVNCGSSSVKLDLLDSASGARRGAAVIERIGTAECRIVVAGSEPRFVPGASHADAMAAALPALLGDTKPEVVGHRVAHGGAEFTTPVVIDAAVEAAIEALVPLAPLHNPANLEGIRALRHAFPAAVQVAVFDTAFHATLPTRARLYALPQEVSERFGLRRYGFHGTSHEWVARRAADHLGEDLRDLRIITCHLGNGCSVAAIEQGRSIETSMGMTPLEGLVMGTRSGDIDAGVLLTLLRGGYSVDALDALLNRESGLAGLSGVGNDLRDIEERASEGDERCRRALQVFAHRARKYIGAYAAVMGGVDAIVFTGGIGENSALMRHRITQRLDFLGARLDEDANRDARPSREAPVARISSPHARCRIFAVQTDEAWGIARAAEHIYRGAQKVGDAQRIPVAVSARHIHLTRESVDILFGEGHQLTPRKPLSQPGQFACEETLTVVGPKRSIEGVRILGPERRVNQVEISRTDEFYLGVDAPIRDSGDVASSPGVTLIGPKGKLTLSEGLICARRHIHMAPEDAERFGVANGDVVDVAVDTAGRDLVFGDVLIRVSPKYRLEMHIDTDEANAAEISGASEGALVPPDGHVRLLERRTTLGPS